MKRVISSLLLIGLLAMPASGQWSALSQQQQCTTGQCPISQTTNESLLPPQLHRPTSVANRDASVVQVISRRKEHSLKGTGVIIDSLDGTATIVSCAHILKEGYRPSIRYFNGQERPAKIIVADALADLSVLQAEIVEDARIIKMDCDPQPGTQVYYYGYAANGFVKGGGIVYGYEASNIIFTAEVDYGVSGGPIWTKRGLVGIVTESRYYPGKPWRTYGPSLTRIRRLLKKVLPPYPNRPGIIVPKPPVRKKPVPRTSRPIPKIAISAPLMPVVFPPAGATIQIEATINARLDRIEKLIAILVKQPSQPGPAGPQGPPGDDGKAGPIGLSGKDAPLQPIPLDDIITELMAYFPDSLTNAQIVSLAARLPPIYLRAKDPNTGNLSKEIQIRLGEGGVIVITKVVHSVPTSGGK